MKTKTVIQLDAEGYAVGQVQADESPREPGVFLIPGGCIEAEWPSVPQGQRARWTGQGWALEAIPEPPPPPAPPSAAEVRRGEILGRLAVIDTESIRALRATVSATAKGKPAPAFDANKLEALETEAAALRAELAGLGA